MPEVNAQPPNGYCAPLYITHSKRHNSTIYEYGWSISMTLSRLSTKHKPFYLHIAPFYLLQVEVMPHYRKIDKTRAGAAKDR
jgi:hypothetical protein